jgi:hypothetical protein
VQRARVARRVQDHETGLNESGVSSFELVGFLGENCVLEANYT